jgi:hypothetical protein
VLCSGLVGLDQGRERIDSWASSAIEGWSSITGIPRRGSLSFGILKTGVYSWE